MAERMGWCATDPRTSGETPELIVYESALVPTQPSSAPKLSPKSKNEVESPVPEDLHPLNAFEVKNDILYRASMPVLPTESIGHITMFLEAFPNSSVMVIILVKVARGWRGKTASDGVVRMPILIVTSLVVQLAECHKWWLAEIAVEPFSNLWVPNSVLKPLNCFQND